MEHEGEEKVQVSLSQHTLSDRPVSSEYVEVIFA